MALPHIKCSVESCRYWAHGEQCNASAIEVNVEGGGTRAHSSEQTNCHTFAPK